jgi:hypothetical protein
MSKACSVGLISLTIKNKKDHWEAKKKMHQEFGNIKTPTMHPMHDVEH